MERKTKKKKQKPCQISQTEPKKTGKKEEEIANSTKNTHKTLISR
jgi:hypothetical protein